MVNIYWRGYKGASINHVDNEGGRGVPEKTMSVHKGGGGVRGWSTWTKFFNKLQH